MFHRPIHSDRPVSLWIRHGKRQDPAHETVPAKCALCGQRETALALIDIPENGLIDESVDLKEVSFWREEAARLPATQLPASLLYPDQEDVVQKA